MVTVEVRGPGHHERSELAARLVAVLARASLRCEVRLDVRPRLAADIEAQLDAGASSVLLRGSRFWARATAQAAPPEPSDVDVVVVLRATADPLAVFGVAEGLGPGWVRKLEEEEVPVGS